MNFLGRMTKSISLFRVHLTDVFVIPVESRGVLLQRRRSIMSLDKPWPLWEDRWQPLVARTVGRPKASHSDSQQPEPSPRQHPHRHGARWADVSMGELTQHLPADTKGFASCVTFLKFMSDTHINDSRWRNSQRTAIRNSSKPTKGADYNAITQHIAIQNGSSHLTREKKICHQLNRLILYSVWWKDPKGYQSTPSLFLWDTLHSKQPQPLAEKTRSFTNLTGAQRSRVPPGSLSQTHIFRVKSYSALVLHQPLFHSSVNYCSYPQFHLTWEELSSITPAMPARRRDGQDSGGARRQGLSTQSS